jgi:hypothetical protein
MDPILPSWFKYRQGKAEPAGDNSYRLSGPNLGPALICIHEPEPGKWAAVLRSDQEGQEIAATEPVFESPGQAWEAAFELFRQHVIY